MEDLRDVRYRIGTDAYMAPEQCDPERLGPMASAADVWGIGATLFHAAAGTRPISRGVRDASGTERFPQLVEAPRPLPKTVEPELAELIAACLAFEPERRPRAAEIVEQLERLVADLPQRAIMSRFRVRPRPR